MRNIWKNRAHVVMALPAFLVLFFIMYVPMAGLVMAFKAFDYSKGIFASPWTGIENFKFLLASTSTFFTMTKNTVLYYLLFTSVGTVLNVSLAIAIDNMLLKRAAKTMQTLMIIPVFISYAAVQFIVYAFISSDTGLINNTLGINVKFYSTAKFWPWVLLITKIFEWMKKAGILVGFVERLERRAMSKSTTIQRYEFLGLVLFVGIPLPGTGAWTGSLIAALLGVKNRKAVPAVLLGILLATVIMCVVSYKILGRIW